MKAEEFLSNEVWPGIYFDLGRVMAESSKAERGAGEADLAMTAEELALGKTRHELQVVTGAVDQFRRRPGSPELRQSIESGARSAADELAVLTTPTARALTSRLREMTVDDLLTDQVWNEIRSALGQIGVEIRDVDHAEAAAPTGGIDLRNGEYLKVVDHDPSGMPIFDPAQLQKLRQDLRGFVPVPVGNPHPVDLPQLLGQARDDVGSPAAAAAPASNPMARRDEEV